MSGNKMEWVFLIKKCITVLPLIRKKLLFFFLTGHNTYYIGTPDKLENDSRGNFIQISRIRSSSNIPLGQNWRICCNLFSFPRKEESWKDYNYKGNSRGLKGYAITSTIHSNKTILTTIGPIGVLTLNRKPVKKPVLLRRLIVSVLVSVLWVLMTQMSWLLKCDQGINRLSGSIRDPNKLNSIP